MWYIVEYQVDLGFVLVKVESCLLISRHVPEDLPADPKFNSVKQIMSELSQYHPELRASRVKDLPNKGFLTIGNTSRDIKVKIK